MVDEGVHLEFPQSTWLPENQPVHGAKPLINVTYPEENVYLFPVTLMTDAPYAQPASLISLNVK
jgi:hypothetical protein